jgi:hypothetical protein
MKIIVNHAFLLVSFLSFSLSLVKGITDFFLVTHTDLALNFEKNDAVNKHKWQSTQQLEAAAGCSRVGQQGPPTPLPCTSD